jgi:DNA-binding transcriptional LysR family regulator
MFTEMRTFVLFGEEGSIRRVSERLPLTQPAVSRQIQRLEQALGVTLLDRRQKPPVLTPVGHQVLATSREMLALFESLKSLSKTTEPHGVFRLGLAHGLASDQLGDAIVSAVANFPKVSLRLKSGWTTELAVQHQAGMLDATILVSDGTRFQNAEHLGKESFAVIRGQGPWNKTRLEQAGWVLSSEQCEARAQLAHVAARRGAALRVVAEVDDVSMQRALVQRGVGLGLMPRRLLKTGTPKGLKTVKIDSELCLDVLLLRSPHLASMSKVADTISAVVRQFLSGGASKHGRTTSEQTVSD